MTQWYPKLCEYDYMGWHPNPYVGREFHGVWGDFEVNIKIDQNQIVAGSGILQNPGEIGFGYEKGRPAKMVDEEGKLPGPQIRIISTQKFKYQMVLSYVSSIRNLRT